MGGTFSPLLAMMTITSADGAVLGACLALAVATLLVIGHYRRELVRQRLLRQMDHRHCWDVMRNRR